MDGSETLEYNRKEAKKGGGRTRQSAQRRKGKLNARERLDILFDNDTFNELDIFVKSRYESNEVYGDGVITGYGKINGKTVYAYAHDFTVYGGTISEMNSRKISKIMDLALENGCPIIGLNDSGGARIQEGILSLEGCAQIFYRNVKCSGVIPQITAIMGPCAGAASYSPALTDFVFQVNKTGQIFVTGPEVVQEAIGEISTVEELGGIELQSKISGTTHFVAENDEECIAGIRELLEYFPQNNSTSPPSSEHIEYSESNSIKCESILPENSNEPYDMTKIIQLVFDSDSFFEVHKLWAKNIICGFARLAGHPVGIVANQPLHLAGSIDVDAAIKASRFVRFCDCFNIPLIVLVDVPGFYPGVEQESKGIIRNGAKLLYAFCEATVPRLTVTIRKAYGGAHIVMNSKNLFADFNFAWTSAEYAVMSPRGAAKILYRKELSKSPNDSKVLDKLTEKYREDYAHPYTAANLGFVDEIIHPRETREKLITSLEALSNKRIKVERKKHGNMPL